MVAGTEFELDARASQAVKSVRIRTVAEIEIKGLGNRNAGLSSVVNTTMVSPNIGVNKIKPLTIKPNSTNLTQSHRKAEINPLAEKLTLLAIHFNAMNDYM